MRGAPGETAKLIRAKVHGAVDHGPRREGSGERANALRHATYEAVAVALLEQLARMHAAERGEHHELGAQQPHAVDILRGDLHRPLGLGQIDVDARRSHDRRRAASRGSLTRREL